MLFRNINSNKIAGIRELWAIIMKTMNLSVIILLILGLGKTFAQENKIKFKYSPGNFAYVGIVNVFTFQTTSNHERIFTCSSGKIENDNGELSFRTSKAEPSEFRVFKIEGLDTTLEFIQNVIVKKTPDPTIAINKIQILKYTDKQSFITANYLDGYLDVDIESLKNGFKIESFELRIVTKKKSFKYISNSKLFTLEMKEAFKSLKSGDELWFEKVMAHGPDGTTRYLGKDIKTTIK